MNLLLIDDHEVMRKGVKFVVQDLFRGEDIFEAGDENSAIAKLKERPYHLIISDVKMPGSSTFGLTEYIMTTLPDSKLLIFSMNDELIYARKFLQLGAKGFVSKNAGMHELRTAIERILSGRKYLSAGLIDDLADMTDRGGPAGNPFGTLSRRELEICTLLIGGSSVAGIADSLAIAQSTVSTYKLRIFEKLGVKNLAQLIELGQSNSL